VAVTAKKRAASGGDSTVSSGAGPARFLREVYDELRKVVWPTWGELYRYTLVVIFTVVVLGVFIGGVDYALGEGAKRVIYNGVSH
jgi:preprotein translocase subunit SecE